MVVSLYQLAAELEPGAAAAQLSSQESSFLAAVAAMAQAHERPAAESQQGNGHAAISSPVDLMDMVGMGPRTQETSTGLVKQGDEEVRHTQLA